MSRPQSQQGEDKPSPLLWTKRLAMVIQRRHSRGDGLSSPCWGPIPLRSDINVRVE
ncbi:MAG TPA: hypothetical protein VK140_03535 [Ktedonobacteraceae bacterium]|nr:hypothetical protein [Ktedonobacteraceae bacterium]